jgi:hypothetical protein
VHAQRRCSNLAIRRWVDAWCFLRTADVLLKLWGPTPIITPAFQGLNNGATVEENLEASR